jgi:hypothetical protein
MIQARHLFYGLAMLDRFKGLGWKRFYLIFGMCDETFSINYTADIPEDVDRGWFMLFVTFLNQMYWFTGATIGGLAGSLLKFNTEGLSFVMTAMFVVIFLEQWKKEKRRWTAAVGIGASAACLAIFGPDSFMIPTMIAIITLLCLLRRPMGYEKLADETEEESEKLDDETKENSETLTDGTKENSEKLIGESKGKAADPAGPEANSPAAPSDAPDTDHPEGGNL